MVDRTALARSTFDARDGDVLLVTYGEVKIPIAQYTVVGIGGVSFTRQLRVGDDVQGTYDSLYAFLKRSVEKDGRDKLAWWAEEIAAFKASRVPPKPETYR